MNKQEALEKVLARVRLLEEKRTEKPLVSAMDSVSRLRGLAGHLEDDRRPITREELTEVAAICVHLLRDEVEVVEGRTLEEWLAERKSERKPVNGRIGAPVRDMHIYPTPDAFPRPQDLPVPEGRRQRS